MKRIFTQFFFTVFLLNLSAESFSQVTIQIGTGTGITGTTTPAPVNIYYRNTHLQILYLKTEINAQSIFGPQILDQMQFNVMGVPIYAMPNYAVKIKHLVSNTLAAYDPGPFSTVYTNASLMPVAGWFPYNFSTPFIWNGNDNILIDICWDLVNPTWNASGTVQYTATTQTARYYWSDATAACPQATTTDVSAYRPNIKLRFTPLTPCTGAPVVGTASITSACPTTLSLTGTTLAGNLSIQWQKRETCGGISGWVNIPGAIGGNYTIGSQTVPTEYRAYIICNTSNLSDTSNIIALAAVAPCYCTPSTTYGCGIDYISNVTFAGINNSTGCTGVAGPSVTNYAAPNPFLTKGATYSLSVTTGGDVEGISVWIDFNINGIFEASEAVINNQYIGTNPATYTANVLVPLTATTGQTKMRVRCQWLAGVPDPCANTSYGEAEDYDVYIRYSPTVTGDGVFCSGDNVTMTATAPGISNQHTFVWYQGTPPNLSFIDTTASITFSNVQVPTTGPYTVYVVTYPCGGGAGDTSGPKTVNLWINQTPQPPIVAPVITYCQYAVFDSIDIFGQNLKWYTVPVGGVASTVTPVVNTSTFSSATYYVSQTIAGCESARSPVTINVVPQAPPPMVKTPIGYCQGDVSTPLEATGQNIRWYSVATGGVGTPIIPVPNTNAQGTFTWYATQTIDGCESPRVAVVVNISYRPNALILTDRPFVCQYDTMSIYYFGNATNSADYVWTLPNGASIAGGGGAGPLVIRFDTAGIHRVRLVVDNQGCIGPEAYVDVTVRLSPVARLDLQPDACQGDIINLALAYSTQGIDHFDWDFMGGQVIYGSFTAGPYGVQWNSAGDKYITVIATDEGCKSLPVIDTIKVHPLPDAHIIGVSANDICSGDSVRLETGYDPNYSYQWKPEKFFEATNEAVQWAVIDFSGQVSVQVTSQYNCKASDSVLITAKPCCEITLPNVFTPNNDGHNDIFRIISIGNHKLSVFKLLNRWGQTVYETNNEKAGWDGVFGGKPQDMGTYQYYIKYKCSDGNYYEKKGDFILMR